MKIVNSMDANCVGSRFIVIHDDSVWIIRRGSKQETQVVQRNGSLWGKRAGPILPLVVKHVGYPLT